MFFLKNILSPSIPRGQKENCAMKKLYKDHWYLLKYSTFSITNQKKNTSPSGIYNKITLHIPLISFIGNPISAFLLTSLFLLRKIKN